VRQLFNWPGHNTRRSQGRLSLGCRNWPTGIVVETCDGATAEGAHELSSAHSRISANPTSTRRLDAVANARAHRSCSGGLASLASKRGLAPRMCSATARPTEGGMPLQWVRAGKSAKRRSEGELLEMDLGGGGRATGSAGPFIQLQSGGRPVHARCPIGRAPNPGGQTAVLR
jgi:hypothetical protein